MRENKSVMNNLVHISAAIAEASRKNQEAGAADAFDTSASAAETQENRMATPPASGPAQDKEILNEALQRRYDELQRMRLDLSARLAEETAKVQSAIRKKEELLRSLEDMRGILANAEKEFDCRDQTKLAAECRAAENVRLGLIRIAPLLAEEETARKTAGGTGSSLMTELRSLTFSQLAGTGWGFLFPLILSVIIAAVIIAAAVILSFNGMFVW